MNDYDPVKESAAGLEKIREMVAGTEHELVMKLQLLYSSVFYMADESLLASKKCVSMLQAASFVVASLKS